MRPIVKPGTRPWLARLGGWAWVVSPPTMRASIAFGLLSAIFLVLAALWPVLFVLPVLTTVGLAIALVVAHRAVGDSIVGPPDWSYAGVPITGDGFRALEEVWGRFDFARRLFAKVPAGIGWFEVEPHVRELLWEAAGHAAKVSALDTEIADLRYAARGSPQAALARSLAERREEHIQFLRDIDSEGEQLAAAAGNAAAAAEIALARTGSLAALDVVAPTGPTILARQGLADARARLALLADVWAELDESTSILRERIAAEAEDGAGRLSTGSPSRRRRPPKDRGKGRPGR